MNEQPYIDDCDRCGKKDFLKPFPFLYKMASAKEALGRKDEGDGYRQFYGCFDCLEKEKQIASTFPKTWKGPIPWLPEEQIVKTKVRMK